MGLKRFAGGAYIELRVRLRESRPVTTKKPRIERADPRSLADSGGAGAPATGVVTQGGYRVTYLPVDREGLLNLADLEAAITDQSAVVSL